MVTILVLPRRQRLGWIGFGATTLLVGALLYGLALPGTSPTTFGPLSYGTNGGRAGFLEMLRVLGAFSVGALASRWIPARDLLPIVAHRPLPFFIAASIVRLVPTIRDDLDRIRRSQRARGHEPRRSWWSARGALPLLVPLIVGTLRRARDQAVSVELAGVRAGRSR